MKPKLMISYSRRQTPFVDGLYADLERAGYSIWLDYRSLVPAKPWFQQISAGITGADTLLLIVSQDSILSKNVEPEWRLALEHKKRIILLLCEAFALPPELQHCEWVDFRTDYKKGLKQLEGLFDDTNATQATVTLPPQSGFKAPKRFWLALILSIVVLIGSIPTWWTIITPYLLVPLPWQIYKKNYAFSRVVPALLLLPAFLVVSVASFFGEGSILYFLHGIADSFGLAVFTSLVAWLLLALLLTSVMQRRARPEAARVRFADPLLVEVKKPQSVVFGIDHAPEDGKYADDLRRKLESFGHRLASGGENPQAAFVFISAYKHKTKYDPDRVAVFPILLQAVGEIEEKLQRIQWIDFRRGMGSMDKLAKLLPEPDKLLQALAVAPTGSQEIFPLPVNVLRYFYIIFGVLGGGGLLTSILSIGSLLHSGSLGPEYLYSLSLAAIIGLVLFGSVFYSIRGLSSRKGGTAAVYPLLVLTLLQVLLHVTNFAVLMTPSANIDPTDLTYTAVSGVGYTAMAVPVGLIVLLPFIIFGWRTFYRWLPRRQESGVGKLESLLMLYSPLRMRALIFHVLFHACLFLIALLLIDAVNGLLNPTSGLGYTLFFLVVISLFAWGIRWVARRISK